MKILYEPFKFDEYWTIFSLSTSCNQ